MSAQRLFVAPPPRIDPERLKSPEYSIRAASPSGPCLVHFDPAGNVGAVFFLSVEVWAIYGPIEFLGFVRTLAERRIVAADSHDLQCWLDACSPRQPAGNLN